jgi:hypothetical protein
VTFTLLTEFWWIQIVYNCFPVLAQERIKEQSRGNDTNDLDRITTAPLRASPGPLEKAKRWAKRERADWADFASLPIFYSGFRHRQRHRQRQRQRQRPRLKLRAVVGQAVPSDQIADSRLDFNCSYLSDDLVIRYVATLTSPRGGTSG